MRSSNVHAKWIEGAEKKKCSAVLVAKNHSIVVKAAQYLVGARVGFVGYAGTSWSG
jgi:hypothetical protein